MGDEGLRKWRDSGRLKLVRFPEEFIELNSGDQLSRFLTRPWFWLVGFFLALKLIAGWERSGWEGRGLGAWGWMDGNG